MVSLHPCSQMCSFRTEGYCSPAASSHVCGEQGLDRLSDASRFAHGRTRTALGFEAPGLLFCLPHLACSAKGAESHRRSNLVHGESGSFLDPQILTFLSLISQLSIVLQNALEFFKNWRIPVLPLTSCVTLGKLIHLSESQFLHLQNVGSNNTVLSCEN